MVRLNNGESQFSAALNKDILNSVLNRVNEKVPKGNLRTCLRLASIYCPIDKFYTDSVIDHRSELAQLHSPMFPDEICSELQQKQPISQ